METPLHKKEHKAFPYFCEGRPIGSLKIKLSEGAPEWTEDDHAIAEATAERTALALEGARLLEEAKRLQHEKHFYLK